MVKVYTEEEDFGSNTDTVVPTPGTTQYTGSEAGDSVSQRSHRSPTRGYSSQGGGFQVYDEENSDFNASHEQGFVKSSQSSTVQKDLDANRKGMASIESSCSWQVGPLPDSPKQLQNWSWPADSACGPKRHVQVVPEVLASAQAYETPGYDGQHVRPDAKDAKETGEGYDRLDSQKMSRSHDWGYQRGEPRYTTLRCMCLLRRFTRLSEAGAAHHSSFGTQTKPHIPHSRLVGSRGM